MEVFEVDGVWRGGAADASAAIARPPDVPP
jgi:hypothetical protein